MAIVEEHIPRSATVIAGTYAELIEIDMPRFLSLVGSTPSFSIAVMRVISRRLRIMNRRYRSAGRTQAPRLHVSDPDIHEPIPAPVWRHQGSQR